MARFVYVNGRYEPWAEASVHAEDRGFQFADAVYEVCEVRGGRLVDETRHIDRLERSLGELRIPVPMSRAALARVLRETVRRNHVGNGLVYLQISRGARRREFIFPGPEVRPTIVCLARSVPPIKSSDAISETGIAVKTMPDIRWQRCDIKTVMLLPSCLAKEAANAEGAKEAWLVDSDGMITEGASSNAWIIDADGRAVTRQLSEDILPGVTRRTLLDVLAKEGITLIERPFSVKEAAGAREAFTTSATSVVMPVVRIDGRSIGNGAPGLLSLRLRAVFLKIAERSEA